MSTDQTTNRPKTRALAAIQRPDDSGKKVIVGGCGCFVAALAFLGIIGTGLSTLGLFASDPAAAMLAAVLAFLPLIPYAAVLFWLDRNEKEPWYLLVACLVWGGAVATIYAGLYNSAFQTFASSVAGEGLGQYLAAIFAAPVSEEIMKGGALIAVYLLAQRHFDNVLDGVVYGAFIGLGFAVFENFTYYMKPSSPGEVVELFWMRGIVGGIGSHACYTAITGAGIGYFRVKRTGTWRWFVPPIALGVSMLAHFLWNAAGGLIMATGSSRGEQLFFTMPLAVIILSVPFVAMVLAIAFLTLHQEAEFVKNYLGDEPDDVVTAAEVARLVPARHRAKRSARLFFSGEFDQWRAFRRRNLKLVQLAFEKWHMEQESESGDQVAAGVHARRVQELRQELRAR
ncbi:MAG: PrsW family intramembrane metalloprotease [Myxococcota bacterium]